MPGPFVPLDVNYPSDRDIAAAGEAAELLFLRGIAYAKARQTGGFIPDYDIDEVAKRLKKVQPRIDALIKEGLWSKTDGGWQIRGWNRWNESSEDVQAKRERDAERQRRRRAKATDEGVTADVQRDTGVTPSGVTPLEERRVEENRGEERTTLACASDTDPTSTLLIEHVNAYRQPPPLKAQAHAKTEIAALVAEGIAPDRIRRGLERIRAKSLSLSLLPQLVSDAEVIDARRGTADERVAGWLDIAEKFASPTPPTAPKGITA